MTSVVLSSRMRCRGRREACVLQVGFTAFCRVVDTLVLIDNSAATATLVTPRGISRVATAGNPHILLCNRLPSRVIATLCVRQAVKAADGLNCYVRRVALFFVCLFFSCVVIVVCLYLHLFVFAFLAAPLPSWAPLLFPLAYSPFSALVCFCPLCFWFSLGARHPSTLAPLPTQSVTQEAPPFEPQACTLATLLARVECMCSVAHRAGVSSDCHRPRSHQRVSTCAPPSSFSVCCSV